jgi:hypothetical protein
MLKSGHRPVTSVIAARHQPTALTNAFRPILEFSTRVVQEKVIRY